DKRSQIIHFPQTWFNEPSGSISNTLGEQVYLYNVTELPAIQYEFKGETAREKFIRERRRNSIKKGFLHAWRGYTKYAWGYDELMPVTNKSRNSYNGWGATIIDSLDTLWIMNLTKEFEQAKEFVRTVNFTTSENDISVFETTIRYLGGLLSAYEFSRDSIFLEKALELGTALLPSFNSPSGLPYNTWNLTRGRTEPNFPQLSPGILSQAGTLQLEFMKLAQLSGNSEFFYKVCFVPGMLAIGAKVLNRPEDLKVAKRLVETCYWSYDATHTGIGAESIWFISANNTLNEKEKQWIESVHKKNGVPSGLMRIGPEYYLRPGN
ncbi:2882_t:CDS:2, partial [Acaulospora colombiana]